MLYFLCFMYKHLQNIWENRKHRYLLPVQDDMTGFFDYIDRYWYNEVGLDIVCVNDEPTRTNNAQESFNAQLNANVRGKTSHWEFVSK